MIPRLHSIKRIMKYFIIGIVATGGMALTWTLFLRVFSDESLNQTIVFSTTQFVASVLWIYPSFWLNRRFTFKDKDFHAENYSRTVVSAFAIYILSPLISSAITYLVQIFFIRGSINDYSLSLSQFGVETSILYVKYGLQVLGIGISFCLNFLGQNFLLYKKKMVENHSPSIILSEKTL